MSIQFLNEITKVIKITKHGYIRYYRITYGNREKTYFIKEPFQEFFLHGFNYKNIKSN